MLGGMSCFHTGQVPADGGASVRQAKRWPYISILGRGLEYQVCPLGTSVTGRRHSNPAVLGPARALTIVLLNDAVFIGQVGPEVGRRLSLCLSGMASDVTGLCGSSTVAHAPDAALNIRFVHGEHLLQDVGTPILLSYDALLTNADLYGPWG